MNERGRTPGKQPDIERLERNWRRSVKEQAWQAQRYATAWRRLNDQGLSPPPIPNEPFSKYVAQHDTCSTGRCDRCGLDAILIDKDSEKVCAWGCWLERDRELGLERSPDRPVQRAVGRSVVGRSSGRER
jgi:hypothetical protein